MLRSISELKGYATRVSISRRLLASAFRYGEDLTRICNNAETHSRISEIRQLRKTAYMLTGNYAEELKCWCA